MNRTEMENSLTDWIKSDCERMEALQAARSLNLPDWCLAAGFVRNLAWDKLHRYSVHTPLNDIDLIYFKPENTDVSVDLACEVKLSQELAQNWSVKNQARMHLRNNDEPYHSSEDAMRYWPEIETAVGVSMEQSGELRIVAPFGIDALFNRTITINPIRPKPDLFKHRIETKQWLCRWPQLRIYSK